MKCICGYEHYTHYDIEKKQMVTDIGDKKFIKINVNATYASEGNYYNNLNMANIYACPKCGTLKMDIE